jgi:hypothetical protein
MKGTLRAVQHRKLTVRTLAGDVVLPTAYGLDRESGRPVMPLREHLGLHEHQALSPVMEDRLCHLAITAPSYERAAETARRFKIAADDNLIQRAAQRAGERSCVQAERRTAAAFDLRQGKAISHEAGHELAGKRFSMVLMLDGTMLRQRGVDWGLKPASAASEKRVAWHELKAGVVLRIPEGPAGPRLAEAEKWYVATDGGPEAAGRRLYAEALRRGLEQARQVHVIADGAVWIWNLAAEHFPGSVGLLDFYHASGHLWELARTL